MFIISFLELSQFLRNVANEGLKPKFINSRKIIINEKPYTILFVNKLQNQENIPLVLKIIYICFALLFIWLKSSSLLQHSIREQ